MIFDEQTWQPVARATRIAIVLSCHVALAVFMIAGVKLLELVIYYLWSSNDPLLFDQFPLRYLFHTMDVCVIVVFICKGTIEAIRIF